MEYWKQQHCHRIHCIIKSMETGTSRNELLSAIRPVIIVIRIMSSLLQALNQNGFFFFIDFEVELSTFLYQIFIRQMPKYELLKTIHGFWDQV